MSRDIGASQVAGWDIGAANAAAAAAAPSGTSQGVIIAGDGLRARRMVLAGMCMVGNCNRRDFAKKVIVATLLGT